MHKIFVKVLSVFILVAVAGVGSARASEQCPVVSNLANAQSTAFAYIDNDRKSTGDTSVYDLERANSFGVSYGEYGAVSGLARCSAISTQETYGTVAKLETKDITGAEGALNCYCSLNKYQTTNKATIKAITMPWVAYNDRSIANYATPKQCADSCALACATALRSQDMLAYRTKLYNAITKCEDIEGSGGNDNNMRLKEKCENSYGTWNARTNTCSCPANAEIIEGECVCKENYDMVNGKCVLRGSDDSDCSSSGGTWNGTTCVCPTNAEWDGSKCQCLRGYTWIGYQYNPEGCETIESGVDENQVACEDSGGTWNGTTCVCPTGYHLDNGRCVRDTMSQSGRICIATGGTWNGTTCTCPEHAQVDNDGACVCTSGYHLEGGNSLGDSGASCVTNPVGGGRIIRTRMKLASQKYNNVKFQSVRNDLDNTIGVIKDVVAQAITNSNGIGVIASGKQTRPADDYSDANNQENCPAGKQCLLVRGRGGVPHWYEIIDCHENPFFATRTPLPYGLTGDYGGFKYAGTSHNLCEDSGIGCANNEWVISWDNGLVYGESRRVAIAEYAGTVRLPDNVQSGEVCVCRATGYRQLNDGQYESTRTSVDQEYWLSLGWWHLFNSYSGGASSAFTPSDEGCLKACADGYEFYYAGSNPGYFQSLATTCGNSVPMATMCSAHDFLRIVAEFGTTDSEHAGFVAKDGNGAAAGGECAVNGMFYSNAHCNAVTSNAGTWIAEYQTTSGDIGYVYGICGYAQVPSGTTAGSVVTMNASSIVLNYSAENDALVCMVKGYKARVDATETSIPIDKAYVVALGEDASSMGGVRGVFNDVLTVYTSNGSYPGVSAWYNELGSTCVR